jgi:hypothetical protein
MRITANASDTGELGFEIRIRREAFNFTTYSEPLLGADDMNDSCQKINDRENLQNWVTLPWRLSFKPKYVSPNSFTFSSRAAHCARESGSEMKDSTVVKFLRETVLLNDVRQYGSTTNCCK